MGKNSARQAYRTGQGKVVVRAVAEIEETNKGRQQIIVTEIPYQVNKARLIEKMADLVKEKRIEGISAIRDESNRKGMRIVIELKKDANAQIMLKQTCTSIRSCRTASQHDNACHWWTDRPQHSDALRDSQTNI